MKIFLADSSADVRLALQVLIDNEHGMDVVGIAVRVTDLQGQVLASGADLLLLDCDLPGKPQASMLADLKAISPKLKVIALTVGSNIRNRDLIALADAHFSKACSAQGLVETLRVWRDDLRRTPSFDEAVIRRRGES